MKKSILISVIVPIYNVEKYLEEGINSIIAQTYKNLEIILVDDGSTDSSKNIVDRYGKIDNRIRVIHKCNGGIISARKAGVDIATGEYITFVDGDDWIEPVMYQEMIELSADYMPDIVTSGVKRDYGNLTVEEFDQCEEGYYNRKDLEDKVHPIAIYTGVFFESGINMHVYNKLYKAKLIIEKYQQIDDRINVGEDAAIIYPCIYSADSLYIMHKAYYHYRIRDGSCMDNDENGEEERINILKECLYSSLCNNSHVGNNTVKIGIDAIILYAKLLQVPDRVIQEDKNGNIYPFGQLKRNSRIVLYGAGRFGKRVKSVLESKYDISVVAWIDKNSNGQKCEKTQPIETIKFMDEYDYIVIAVLRGNMICKIIKELNEFGIEKDKIAYIEDVDKLESIKTI